MLMGWSNVAPRDSKCSTTATCPLTAAHASAVNPKLSTTCGFTPPFNIIMAFTHPKWPLPDASINAVNPSLS